MGAGSNGQGSSGGNGGNGGHPQGNKPSGSGAQNTTTRKVSFYIDYNEEPAPGETLRFIEKGFDVMPSPVRTRMVETSEAAPLGTRAASSCTRKARNGGARTRDNQAPWITTPAAGARRREQRGR
jgi:hypothetical protein